MMQGCITLFECIEQKVSLPFSASNSKMVKNQSVQLLELLEPTFGNVKELSETIGNAALEVAVTPLADVSDYTAIQKALFVMLEVKKALDTIANQSPPTYRQTLEVWLSETSKGNRTHKPTPFFFIHYRPLL